MKEKRNNAEDLFLAGIQNEVNRFCGIPEGYNADIEYDPNDLCTELRVEVTDAEGNHFMTFKDSEECRNYFSRKCIDNFELLNNMLEFENEDDFYMLQVMKRKKENPEMTKNNQVIKTVYLHRKDQLLELKEDLMSMAEKYNARVYLNPNRKSFKKCTIQCLKEFADRISNEDYHKPYKIFESVAGSSGSKKSVWVVDIDWLGIPEGELRGKYVEDVKKYIDSLRPETDGGKTLAVVPTKNGVHLLTTPFDLQEFRLSVYKLMDVHKNNPTVVYCKI